MIQTGAGADFILLDRNPLLDINNSRRVSAVFMQGKWLCRETLAKTSPQAAFNSANSSNARKRFCGS